MSAYLLLTGVADNSTKTVDIGLEGTLDWLHVADVGPSDIKLQFSDILRRKAGTPGWLWRGLEWRTWGGISTITQTVQRTITVGNPNDVNNSAGSFSSNNKTGYFALNSTAQVGMGYRMVLEAPSWRKLRLRCYSTNFRCNQRATARLMDGETDEVPLQFVDMPSNGTNNIEEWQVDFQGGTDRSMMIFEVVCLSQDASQNQNNGIQAFTLQVIP